MPQDLTETLTFGDFSAPLGGGPIFSSKSYFNKGELASFSLLKHPTPGEAKGAPIARDAAGMTPEAPPNVLESI